MNICVGQVEGHKALRQSAREYLVDILIKIIKQPFIQMINREIATKRIRSPLWFSDWGLSLANSC